MNPLKLATAYSFFEDADWAIAFVPKILQQEIEYPHARSEALASTTSTATRVKPAATTTTDVRALSELQGNFITYPQLQTFVLAATDAYILRIRTVTILLINEATTFGLGNVYGILIGDSEGIAEVIADGFVLREDLFEKTTAVANTTLFGGYIARTKDIQIDAQVSTYGNGKLIKYGHQYISTSADVNAEIKIVRFNSATLSAVGNTNGDFVRIRYSVPSNIEGNLLTEAIANYIANLTIDTSTLTLAELQFLIKKYGSVAITAKVDDELLAMVIIRSSATTSAQSMTDGVGFRRRFLIADNVLGRADTTAIQFKLPSVVELSVREDGFLTTKDIIDRKYYLADGKLKVGQSNVGKIKFKVNRFVLQHNN